MVACVLLFEPSQCTDYVLFAGHTAARMSHSLPSILLFFEDWEIAVCQGVAVSPHLSRISRSEFDVQGRVRHSLLEQGPIGVGVCFIDRSASASLRDAIQLVEYWGVRAQAG